MARERNALETMKVSGKVFRSLAWAIAAIFIDPIADDADAGFERIAAASSGLRPQLFYPPGSSVYAATASTPMGERTVFAQILPNDPRGAPRTIGGSHATAAIALTRVAL